MRFTFAKSQPLHTLILIFVLPLVMGIHEKAMAQKIEANPETDSLINYAKNLQEEAISVYRISNFDSAKILNEQAMLIFKSANDVKNIARCYNIEGSIFRKTGYFPEALVSYRKALTLYGQINDSTGLTNAINCVGQAYKEIGIFDSALFYYFESVRLADLTHDSVGVLYALINITQAYIDIKDNRKAKQYLNECMQLVNPKEDKLTIALLLSRLANLELDEGNYDSSLMLYEQAYDIYHEFGALGQMGSSLNNIGACYKVKGDFSKALEKYQQAMVIYRQINQRYKLLTTRNNIALIYIELKKYKLAKANYDTCLKQARELKVKDIIKDCYYNLYYMYDGLNDHEKALKYYIDYTKIKDSLLNQEKSKTIAELEIQYQNEKKEAEILSLQNQNLAKDLDLKRTSSRKNMYLTGLMVFVLISLFIYIFYKQRLKRNRILAEQKLLQAEEERKHSSARSLLEGQEEERIRISRELHDGVGVMLSTASLYISSLEQVDNGNKELVTKAKDIVSEANSDVRKISRNLMPSVLTIHGLEDALSDLIENFDMLPGKNGDFSVLGNSVEFTKPKEIMIYRLIQELVSNTIKHANAESIDLLLNFSKKNLVINYCDDGLGFNFNEKMLNKSVGLKSIQSRVDFLNGTLESGLNKGCCYTILIPYD